MNLRSDLPFWLIRNGLMGVYPGFDKDAACDALVVGGGISGALLAHELVSRGVDTILVDRRHAAFGSTSASTGLLQYEIDTPLEKLKRLVGTRHAERAYLLGVEAIEGLAKVAGKKSGFARRPSLMLVRNPSQSARLYREFKARVDAGLKVEWLDASEVKSEYGISRPGAIRSSDGAEVDPYRLTHHLLLNAAAKGVRIYDRTELKRYAHDKRGISAYTGKKQRIRARRVFFATGYETQAFLPKDILQVSSTYAFVSEPVTDLTWWKDRTLLWESGEAYLYARTTDDKRILVGGADDDMRNAELRDERVEVKSGKLARDFRKLVPGAVPFETAFSWAGAFGHTTDGLAYIGEYEKFPRAYFALGYGGNGITFSQMACQILADLFEGKRNADAEVFAFERR
ncbi:MAG: NAD(P)/FAD-dependent oxidoreductase [Bryobacteraceae bacterium]